MQPDTTSFIFMLPDTTSITGSTQSNIPMLYIIISITAGGIFVVLVGVVGLAFCFKFKNSKKNKVQAENEGALDPVPGPIYEELDIEEDKTAAIDLSKNIAYEEFQKIKPL